MSATAWLRNRARRYRQQIAANPELWDELSGQYLAARNKAGGTHMDGLNAVRDLEADMMAKRDAQRWLNVDARAKQEGVARQLRVPRGWVMAHEDVTQSLGKGNQAEASAKAAMYAHMYGPAWLQAAQQITAHHTAEQAANARKAESDAALAGKKMEADAIIQGKQIEAQANAKPPELSAPAMANKHLEEVMAMQPGPARIAALQASQTQMLGDRANESAVSDAVQMQMQPIVQGYARRGFHTLTPNERLEVQHATRGLNYNNWLRYTGLMDSPGAQEQYKAITGRAIGIGKQIYDFIF